MKRAVTQYLSNQVVRAARYAGSSVMSSVRSYRNPYGRRRTRRRVRQKARSRRYNIRYGGSYGRYNNKCCKGELKYIDSGFTDQTLATTVQPVNATNLTIIPQGNGPEERHGGEITVKKIHVRLEWGLNATTNVVNTAATLRFLLVQDTQCNGSAIVLADVLEDVGDTQSFYNLENSHRYKILKDKLVTVHAVGGAVLADDSWLSGRSVRNDSFTLNTNIVIKYDHQTTNGSLATLKTNCISMFWQASDAEIAHAKVNFRIRFSDN